MTQEEMANRLGVTTPAVNKWENGNSLPDISLLAPIARLLGITTDMLLSYREELTKEEIQKYIYEMDEKFKTESFDDVFVWAKKIIQLYPNCEWLIVQMAIVLNARNITDNVQNAERYEADIIQYFERSLKSQEEQIRSMAADSLYGFYMRKEQYEKAEEYLKYFSIENPEKKRKLAEIYRKTGRMEEAYKNYEELLFSHYQIISMIFQSLYMMAIEEKDLQKAHIYVDKQSQLAKIFEMGIYHEISCQLDLAVIEKNVDETRKIMQEMLKSVEDICHFTMSDLYQHMQFKVIRKEFFEKMQENLIESFKDEEIYGFLNHK